jgi:hypothetical protein
VHAIKSYGTSRIIAHPCKKRKDGAPSVEMVHTEIAKGGPPATIYQGRAGLTTMARSTTQIRSAGTMTFVITTADATTNVTKAGEEIA